jgi:hypothetical protein
MLSKEQNPAIHLWNTWKERYHPIFTGSRLMFVEVDQLALTDINPCCQFFLVAGVGVVLRGLKLLPLKKMQVFEHISPYI